MVDIVRITFILNGLVNSILKSAIVQIIIVPFN